MSKSSAPWARATFIASSRRRSASGPRPRCEACSSLSTARLLARVGPPRAGLTLSRTALGSRAVRLSLARHLDLRLYANPIKARVRKSAHRRHSYEPGAATAQRELSVRGRSPAFLSPSVATFETLAPGRAGSPRAPTRPLDGVPDTAMTTTDRPPQGRHAMSTNERGPGDPSDAVRHAERRHDARQHGRPSTSAGNRARERTRPPARPRNPRRHPSSRHHGHARPNRTPSRIHIDASAPPAWPVAAGARSGQAGRLGKGHRSARTEPLTRAP